MRELKNAESSVQFDIVYQSEFYTVVRASVKVNGNGKEWTAYAEGVSKRCWLDFTFLPSRGVSIASGRARKALALKLAGIRNTRVVRATDLLMNG